MMMKTYDLVYRATITSTDSNEEGLRGLESKVSQAALLTIAASKSVSNFKFENCTITEKKKES
jgi:hypothetical protein